MASRAQRASSHYLQNIQGLSGTRFFSSLSSQNCNFGRELPLPALRSPQNQSPAYPIGASCSFFPRQRLCPDPGAMANELYIFHGVALSDAAYDASRATASQFMRKSGSPHLRHRAEYRQHYLRVHAVPVPGESSSRQISTHIVVGAIDIEVVGKVVVACCARGDAVPPRRESNLHHSSFPRAALHLLSCLDLYYH
ncbi:hypothetical protein MSAN_01315300 [Mycena sanguinolenta]|uniref:Uncharacterized protein n=1 Tax=Mycena sanguinolenta TaxID=230812 RepID=A0A8H7D0N5_9AGAR|nr:hypothetical protein MSAN_01315300 [Mycena sanguinolenta]